MNDLVVEVWDSDLDAGVVQRCKRVWGGNAQMITDIIDATDDKTILEHNMHVRHPDSLAQGYWGQGRVTLAGDAAHPVRPASGMPALQAGPYLVCRPYWLTFARLPCCWHTHSAAKSVTYTLTLTYNPPFHSLAPPIHCLFAPQLNSICRDDP